MERKNATNDSIFVARFSLIVVSYLLNELRFNY